MLLSLLQPLLFLTTSPYARSSLLPSLAVAALHPRLTTRAVVHYSFSESMPSSSSWCLSLVLLVTSSSHYLLHLTTYYSALCNGLKNSLLLIDSVVWVTTPPPCSRCPTPYYGSWSGSLLVTTCARSPTSCPSSYYTASLATVELPLSSSVPALTTPFH